MESDIYFAMHVERLFKAYFAFFTGIGFMRAYTRYDRPDTIAAMAISTPVLWPSFLALDLIELQLGIGERGRRVLINARGDKQ